jgi:vitamin B12 transporter
MTLRCCMLLLLAPWLAGLLPRPAVGQSDAEDAVPIVYSLQDEQADGAAEDDAPLPEYPEMVVRGRPDPFPANALEGDTVVTPTATEESASTVGSSFSVITEQQIQQSGRANVGEVLRDALGVDVVRQGGPGSLQSIFIRGTNSQHTKVLLDGIPLNDPSNATRGFDFSTLDVENIERIEVLRGPQSLLYGSDAIGGVINIITKRGEGPLSVRSTGRGGSFGTWRQTMSLSGGNDRAYYSFGGAFSDTAGISQAARRLGNSERDAYSNGTLSGRFGWTPSDLLNVDYVFRWANADAEVDDFDLFVGVPTDNLIRHNLSRTFYNRIQAQSLMLDGALEQTVGFGFTLYDRIDTDPQPFVPSDFRGQTRRVNWQANLLVTEHNTFSVGAGYLQEEAESTFNPRAAQNNAGVFLMDQFSLWDFWFVTVGSRWDDWNTAGPANTYRWTNLFRLGQTGTAVHGSIGTGFRAPALAENLFAFGNPDLQPERSKGWDVGVRQQACDGRLEFDCTYFRNDLTNLIVFDFNTFRLENVGQARTTGVEFSVAWSGDRGASLRALYTYTDPTNLDTNTLLLRRPRNKVSLQMGQRILDDRGQVNVEMLYVDRRLDTRDVILGDYFLVNLTGSWALTQRWGIFVRGANLLDQRYEEVSGYGTPGIAGYGGLDFVW